MNNRFYKAIVDSGISEEIISAVQSIAANRTIATPVVLKHFVGWVEPITTPTNTERNTAILAIMSHYVLNTNDVGANS